MNYSEKSLRRRVIKALAPLDAVAVENIACPGFPDIEFVGGTMELKVIPGWPARAQTPVRVPKFRPVQRNWLRRRWRAGGLTLLLLRIGRDEYLLFDGDVAADRLGKVPRRELETEACVVWPPRTFKDGLLLLRYIEYLKRTKPC